MHDLLKAKRYTELIELADYVSSSVFSTAAEHRLCNQLSAVIRKYPFPSGSVGYDPKGAALKTFLASEHKCSRVNRRFQLFLNKRSPHEYALSQARSWISYVLGDLSLSEIWDYCGFGPGASVGVHGNATNDARKLLASSWTVTPSAFHYGLAALSTDIHIWELLLQRPDSPFYPMDPEAFRKAYGDKVELVDYNKIAFVPKTAKTDRTIAVEPLINGYIQKGVDEVMRKRLRRVGINLKDQSRNQTFAREGSLRSETDPYVTIDLSSASDSITTNLCRYLLPHDWFEFLNSIRSPAYLIEGSKAPYEKFTTMGNGFCFPLETLIFASLCSVAYLESRHKPDFLVYGDDIIVRQSTAHRVLDLLEICGFKANTEKTFLSGPFRESCGADWFEGEDVRPVTLDYAFDSLEAIFKFCNISRYKDPISGILCDSLEFLESLIPPDLRLVRPYRGNADTALEVPLDVFLSSPFSRWHRQLMCWSWKEIRVSAEPDFLVQRIAGYNVVVTRGALKGSKSSSPFTERRKVRTKICRVSYAGGWSLFEPDPMGRTYFKPA